ncbi:MAG: DUF2851 family protein [Bacteroidales bacterium]|jgi:hypothetical protein|nr:DUF2851 family protein [Bacteroidales bacterium]
MNEDLLHYIWRFQRLCPNLHTTENISISVEYPGLPNHDAGPDFTQAKIRIGTTLWAGNIEIHLNSSDWYSHRHFLNKAYKNIILHVVYNHDRDIFDVSGNLIPTLELKNFMNEHILENYKRFSANKNNIPCQSLLKNIDSFKIFAWLESQAVERLKYKSGHIKSSLSKTTNDWEQVIYELLAGNFGFNVNAVPFEMLAKSLAFKLFAKHKNHLFQIEALLFGQAGMLNDNFTDAYPANLKKEYEYLRKKYKIHPVEKHLWKFLRIRPGNFPTIRIAQFASFISKTDNLCSKIIEKETPDDFYKLMNVHCSEYWETHYLFDIPSVKKAKPLGRAAMNLIIINTIVPFMFVYGKEKSMPHICDRALDLLSGLPPEKNHIVKHFESSGFKPQNALQTQALIQLYKNYCQAKKCLHCAIGDAVLTQIPH